ncbi:hypothetical protein N7499_003263 [Penicillium canescens]|uniref:uncharacterized protein n=1 Tax=Penicillium canescens TaxID=5083 RepID=UPI0026E02E00|nr:uncharacterized protein N7446_014025 [Penicillium canescens]KAJ6039277.1 hypothetical protein N7446_014025 [Penicillium canescens]KAJ6091112.1 hypothetical protein N7499_003263 [Penicillium canescens]KAJ6174712.1 hypothetical protein N7485_005156 [Penicillium canescens]
MVDRKLILGTQILTFRLHMALEGHPIFQPTEEIKPRPGSPRKLLLASALDGGPFTEDGSTRGPCASSPDFQIKSPSSLDALSDCEEET